ncbi:MAG: hypothetical protein ACREEC_07310, partial [Thermoplasmata archaeon]
MGRGRIEPEEELEFFFREVEANTGGAEGADRHLLAHLLDGLDDVERSEGAGHHAGGEEAEVDRGKGEGLRESQAAIDRGDGTEVLEDTGDGALAD